IVVDGPDAYFSRLPLAAIVRVLKHRNIPIGLSLSAGVYVCNTVMYAGLHALRRPRNVPAGFIHLPYEAAQAAHHRAAASMSREMMTDGIALLLGVHARRLSPGRGGDERPARSRLPLGYLIATALGGDAIPP